MNKDNAGILFSHLNEMDSKTQYKSVFNSNLIKLIGDILSLGQGICTNPKRFTKMMNLNLNQVKKEILNFLTIFLFKGQRNDQKN